MREEKLKQISDDLLIIPPLIGKSISNVLLKTVFSAIKDDISPLHFGIMKALHDAGEAPISKVAEWLQIPRSQMTHMVDKLENLGYLSRQVDTTDRRSIKIKLTDSGKQVYGEWVDTVRHGTCAILNYLTDDELNDLANSLATLRDIIVKIVRNHYLAENSPKKTAKI